MAHHRVPEPDRNDEDPWRYAPRTAWHDRADVVLAGMLSGLTVMLVIAIYVLRVGW